MQRRNSHLNNPDNATAPIVGLQYDEIMPEETAHQHKRGQLIYCAQGNFQLTIADRYFLVPPVHAVWIPANTLHAAHSRNQVQFRSLYFSKAYSAKLPKTVSVLTITPLLKQLILKICAFPINYPTQSAEARLARVVLDELCAMSSTNFSLPLPDNEQIKKIHSYLIEQENIALTVANVAEHFAMSDKTLTRLFQKELGMTFSAWHTQLKLITAISLLSEAYSTTYIAQHLGYSNDSAFITMFKRHTQQTPSDFKRAYNKDASL